MSEDLTIESLAAMDYEPWDLTKCDLPTTQEYIESSHSDLMFVRLGHALCCKSKQENADLAAAMGGNETANLMDALERISLFYKALHLTVESGRTRLMVGMAVLVTREDQDA